MKEKLKITYAGEKRKRGAVLKVIGVGGGGGNAVNRMIEEGLKGVEFVAVNTDVQDLSNIKEPALCVQIGDKITKGLGVGSNSDLGAQAALENTDAIIEVLESANMVFITAGMGGGTGTGASQVVANHASSMGILTVAIVTKPFDFEGDSRMQTAEDGIAHLVESVDAIIVIPNQKLFELEDVDISFKDAYKKVDEILLKAVRGISDIINTPGYQNVDFADVKATMSEKGMTLMGTGEARGENRAEEATRKALTSPLLDDFSINGATGVLYNITAASTLTLKEIGVIAEIIRSNVSANARIKFGVVEEESLGDVLRVTVIATGFKKSSEKALRPGSRKKAAHITGRQTPTGFNFDNNMDADKSRGSSPDAVRTPTPEHIPAPEKPKKRVLDGQQSYNFRRKSTPVNLADYDREYLNENRVPSMMSNPEHEDDILDVPSFQRPKITEKK
ncbi:MAG: cell division protein FtsZ [Candidatus Aminicenantes bacterium]|nr:cell division protein FtsZ [Candidatus Aminicenantes bacterium]